MNRVVIELQTAKWILAEIFSPGPEGHRGPDPNPLAEGSWIEERKCSAAFSLKNDCGKDPRARAGPRRAVGGRPALHEPG